MALPALLAGRIAEWAAILVAVVGSTVTGMACGVSFIYEVK